MTRQWTRSQVLAARVRSHQLDRDPGTTTDPDDVTALDLGVQDTGPDGSGWALHLRGAELEPADLFWAWTLRGAPHAYRRAQAAAVAAATAPWSDADAAKRIFDAAKPLREAGIPAQDALDEIATQMRDVVRRPTVKGEVSSALHERLPPPYQRWCRPCEAEHLYEQPFRLAALRAGLELEPGTAPPVLRRIPGWRGLAARPSPALDPVRAVLRLQGPATAKQVADYVDAPVAEITAHLPGDALEVQVDGQRRWALPDSEPVEPGEVAGVVRLLGPYDLFLQTRDRELVVPDAARRKELWRVLGRPGGILAGHELVGAWRPRASGKKLRVQLEAWSRLPRRSVLEEQGERLAAFRGVSFAGFVDAS
jgi:hypothetical protein